MTKSLVLVPPFIKYSAGPLLGPSLLQSAARSRGHQCSVIDLNAMYIRPRASKRMVVGNFVGDHDKPTGSRSLAKVESEFMSHVVSALKRAPSFMDSERSGNISSNGAGHRVKYGFLTHGQISEASVILSENPFFGDWVKDIFEKHCHSTPPEVIGVSLLHAGQVIPSAAITMITRQLWPEALVVWGGPHISGLGKQTLKQDLMKRSFAADTFVTGHAEETFVQILDRAATLKSATSDSPIVLEGKSTVVSPVFDNLDLYDAPLTFPAQSTIGCSYGRCSYCTYPKIEGRPQKLDLDSTVGAVVDQAQQFQGSTISLKDSLATPRRLAEIGDCIQNRNRWSACTKLSPRLDAALLTRLDAARLSTLEVGLESLLPETQRRILKIQPQSMFEDFLVSVAGLPNELSIVVNYMINFPWEHPEASLSKLHEAETLLMGILGKERGLIEVNEFEMERLAPLAKFPESYGIDPATIMSWPWASVLEMRKRPVSVVDC